MKKIFLILLVLLLLAAAWFAGTGFTKRTDVFLTAYSVSEDGSRIHMQVGIASSMGYTRSFRAKQGGFNQYVTFYNTFGGLNSKIGAKNSFVLEIDPMNCDEIYFYHGDGGYTLVLKKDTSTGQWNTP